eukprot:5235296-Lingulodinium_polyedra.AAC.1
MRRGGAGRQAALAARAGSLDGAPALGPPRLPTARPIGCSPPPAAWPALPDVFATVDEATDAWQRVVTCVEDE